MDANSENKIAQTPMTLPVAESERWQPLRSGLVNFYRYDDQEFHFHKGRLLLRGNNGTGKSRVLALQLPFLLDGETSPHRIEPDGDSAKRFEWNLLMGKYADRLGYTWIEFGRRDNDGEHYRTLGCGVRAVSGRGVVGKWLFVTPQRIGRDLSLCSSQGNPLPKDALAEALGQSDRLFTSASDYRAAVNRELFGLRQDRYDALVDLLIELRQPQLARQLDEGRLSGALSNALAPVSQKMTSQVADAMRGLEADRHALESLVAAKQATDAFLLDYRQYAAILAGRRTEEVRTAQNDYERRLRKLREAETGHAKAEGDCKTMTQELESLLLAQAAASGEKQTLESSPEMRSARELDAASTRANDCGATLAGVTLEHESAARDQAEVERVVERSVERSRVVAAALAGHAEQAHATGTACGVSHEHDDEVRRGDVLQTDDMTRLEKSQRTLDEVARKRRQSIRVLESLNAGVEAARRVLQSETQKRDQEEERVFEAVAAVDASEKVVATSVNELAEAYRQWHASVTVLIPAGPTEVVPAIQSWCDDDIASTSPVRSAVTSALAELTSALAIDRAEKKQELRAAEETVRLLREEHERLSKGEHQPPPEPHTREAGLRSQRPGAPLWMLCEFLDPVPADVRAGVEAALESSGLLDAWVNPDGTVIGADDALDHFLLDDDRASTPTGTATLAELMRPSIDRVGTAGMIPAERIERIIRRIGLGENDGALWVDVNGRWRIGPATGRWMKLTAQHIGQAARDAARLRRLRELDLELESLAQSLSAIRNALNELDQRETAARAEASRAPNDNGIRTAVAERDAHRKQLAHGRVRLQDAQIQVAAKAQELEQKTSERDTAATDLRLREWVDRLPALIDALGDYQQALAALWPAARERIAVDQALQTERSRLEQSRVRTTRLHATAQDAHQKAAAATAEYDTLRQTVGAVVEEVQQRLRDVELRIRKIRVKQSETERLLGALQERVKSLALAIDEHAAEIKTDIANRARAIDHFFRFAGTGLLAMALPGESALPADSKDDLSITAVVELARRIGTALEKIAHDDDAWDRNQKLIHHDVQALTSALQHHDYRPESTTENEVLVVTVPFKEARRKMDEFSTMLAEEVVNRNALLTSKERELLENYLIHDVAVELGRLIRNAEELVRDMNKQLSARPTSTGMMLRFKWDALPEGPAAFSEARRKLLGESSTWSPQERRALGEFLQQQIRNVRETESAGTWQEQLTAAFDYRRWHQFYVERKQEGDWQRLTKRTHGTGSGGEKALALTIPQFAAAAAYYGSAGKLAPRLILLDEAFVGIDSDMRAKCMGMLHEFDLDFVMTSEREWGCYSTMPGLAIYQLSARAGIDAVWASRWIWNGRGLTQDNRIIERAATDKGPGALFHNNNEEPAT